MMKDFLKQIDIFGREVNLRFRGEDTFKTTIGGFLTILLIVLMGTVLLYESILIWFGKIDQTLYMIKDIEKGESWY